MGPKIAILLNLSLEKNLYHYFEAKLYGKSNGDSLKPLERCIDPETDLNCLMPNIWPKIENLQFEQGKKLNHHFGAKFFDKSNGDSPVARKRCVLT